MKNKQNVYKLERNEKIYEEYVGTKTSFNKLAKKYNLSPQRISYIVNDAEEKGLGKKLKPDAKQKKREDYKKLAIEIRESGKLRFALSMLKQIEKWDQENRNPRGQMDILGHLRITYTRLAKQESDKHKREEYRENALEAAKKAIKLGEGNNDIPKGPKAIQQIHFASASVDYAKDLKGPQKEKVLKEALESINQSIEGLPGSQAHKAWPSYAKSKIQYELGDVLNAVETLTTAEKWIFEGYNKEIENGDQAELKLNVWLSGLHLSLADIAMREQKSILAKHYATSVLHISDPQNMLGERKKEAKKILKKLNG